MATCIDGQWSSYSKCLLENCSYRITNASFDGYALAVGKDAPHKAELSPSSHTNLWQQWKIIAEIGDGDFYYRLSNAGIEDQGLNLTFDTEAAAPHYAKMTPAEGKYSGQMWYLLPSAGDGWHQLYNRYLGVNKGLDSKLYQGKYPIFMNDAAKTNANKHWQFNPHPSCSPTP